FSLGTIRRARFAPGNDVGMLRRVAEVDRRESRRVTGGKRLQRRLVDGILRAVSGLGPVLRQVGLVRLRLTTRIW
ncbi:MAG: hypothetical protein ACREOG_03815, partial [Gemmatimonadaceae bacterium]